MDTDLQNDVPLLQVPVPAGQSGAGHLLDEELAAQAEAVLCRGSQGTETMHDAQAGNGLNCLNLAFIQSYHRRQADNCCCWATKMQLCQLLKIMLTTGCRNFILSITRKLKKTI